MSFICRTRAHGITQGVRYTRLLNGNLCINRSISTASSNPKPASSRLTYLGFGAVGLGVASYFFIPSNSRSAPTYGNKPLSPNYFTPSIVTSSEDSGPDTKLITLQVAPHLLPTTQSADISPIWSVYIKDDDIQVERQYTPLEGVDNEGRMSFWVKKYPKGEVGRWLHSKKVGDTVEIRGPLKTWEWKEDVWDEIVMVLTSHPFDPHAPTVFQISGGTGITPFYQLFSSAINRGNLVSPQTRFTLLHSSRVPSELPPHDLLQNLAFSANAQSNRIKVHYFVDSFDGPPNSSVPNEDLQLGRINRRAIDRVLGFESSASWWQRLLKSNDTSRRDRKVLFLVCGPEQ